jgi:hypothetical protein
MTNLPYLGKGQENSLRGERVGHIQNISRKYQSRSGNSWTRVVKSFFNLGTDPLRQIWIMARKSLESQDGAATNVFPVLSVVYSEK